MNNIKKLISVRNIVLSFALGFILGIIIKKTYELTAKQPHKWDSMPIIVNCIGNEIKEKTIIDAIKYWEKHGEKVYFYEYQPPEFLCNKKDKELFGFIILRKEDVNNILEDNVLASTKRYTILGTIYAGEIYFSEDSYNMHYLLTHELGHAFGFKHKQVQGHIMHPYYDFMGSKFW